MKLIRLPNLVVSKIICEISVTAIVVAVAVVELLFSSSLCDRSNHTVFSVENFTFRTEFSCKRKIIIKEMSAICFVLFNMKKLLDIHINAMEKIHISEWRNGWMDEWTKWKRWNCRNWEFIKLKTKMIHTHGPTMSWMSSTKNSNKWPNPIRLVVLFVTNLSKVLLFEKFKAASYRVHTPPPWK